jgi:hypothetical protein
VLAASIIGSIITLIKEAASTSEMTSLITLMMEAARTSQTLVNFYQTTRHYNPEDNHFHTGCSENLKSYKGYDGLADSEI